MFAKILATLLGAPAEKLADFFIAKQKLKQDLKLAKLSGKIAIEKAKEARAIAADANDAAWSQLQIQNSGWKDEFVLIVLAVPLIMSFIPGLAKYVTAGFTALEQTPTWYLVLVVTIFLAVYGIKKKSLFAKADLSVKKD